MIQSIGMNTSLPQFGPFMNEPLSGSGGGRCCTPGCSVGIKRQRDAEVFVVAEQVVGIVELEREAEQASRSGPSVM